MSRIFLVSLIQTFDAKKLSRIICESCQTKNSIQSRCLDEEFELLNSSRTHELLVKCQVDFRMLSFSTCDRNFMPRVRVLLLYPFRTSKHFHSNHKNSWLFDHMGIQIV